MERSNRKVRIGMVISDKMDKTATVAVYKHEAHPLYSKRVKITKKYKVHDEENTCHVGDKVKIMETRPLSKSKRWRLVEVILRAK